ncbi:uncharacterized protein LOC121238885 isoform X1 [Juglans microcarpa x Juglans regia]|uniref:uncharacterized protein LOC121238885 isoform X1 n=1 Tax=Juglans microcarpa x Juglans regia TaxID=2249226 RepID=UPI001B7EECD7|nr:uncharacterized protein LOC121238885 isoform X1 [Juglans microcarpa x Juglans regia]
MATPAIASKYGKKRKRKRSAAERKLGIGERVEVRSEEDGFQGSWHPGTVIACYNQGRRVKYDHILCNDGSDNLEDAVHVSPLLDGIDFATAKSHNYRGSIRPLPPHVEFNKWGLPYGLCVDVYYQDAWWEGVIFDRNEGSDERRIFFPDLGDELKTGIHMFRITQDWSEVTENWQPRGTWLFLQLIEEYEQEAYLGVSVKQIWYDLRGKKGFGEIKVWTCTRKDLWKELMLEVIDENLSIILKDVFWVFNPWGLLQETSGGLVSARTTVEVDMSPEANLANSLAIVPVENELCSDSFIDQEKPSVDGLFSTLDVDESDIKLLADSNVPCHSKAVCLVAENLPVLPSNPDGISSTNSVTIGEELSSTNSHKINWNPKCLTLRKTKYWLPAGPDLVPGAAFCPIAVTDYAHLSMNNRKPGNSLTTNVRKHLSYLGWKIEFMRDGGINRLRYTSPDGKCYYSLRQVCDDMRESSTEMISLISDGQRSLHISPDHNTRTLRLKASFPKLKRRKLFGRLTNLRNGLQSHCPTRILLSSKRVQQVVTPRPSHHNPRTVLSWLIDNNVVLPRAKVYYCSRDSHHSMAEGRITRDGIKCSCCEMVFTLHNFEVHAGSKNHRPAANIFLEDGRSLLDCQMQMMRAQKIGSFMRKPEDRIDENSHEGKNDNICSVCHYGGELILCDNCPSAFHTGCLNLKDVPDGDWFCPSCCCGICGQRKFESNCEHLVDDTVLTCNQCGRKYHVGCLRNRGADKLEIYPEDKWFCCKKCEQIFLGLQETLGKPSPVGEGTLSWTLLKPMTPDSHDVEALSENYSKLSVALGVLHECFEPIKEPRTCTDLVEDVIFSRGSELNRLNFRGFYTVLLERNDEMIAVATVRIYGGKVAEIPLVGTRLRYRRRGMCRILMNELEKKLMELEVERLFLPATPSVLNTWTTSFGFTKMTSLDRFLFLDYTFLDFPDTVMCQKLLRKNPPIDSKPSRGTQHDLVCGTRDDTDLDVSSAVSEVYQSEQVDESTFIKQGLVTTAGTKGGGSISPVDMVDQQCLSETSRECLVEAANFDKTVRKKSDSDLKFYKRRRVS